MVKHLPSGIRCVIWLALLLLLYAVIWLQGGPRQINWAKGWLVEALNPPNAPYDISIGDVSLQWTDIASFGDLSVTTLQMSRKDGGIFATIPQVNITLDALGFLPHHRSIHGIALDKPHLYLVRDKEGIVRLGVDGMPETLAVGDVLKFFASDDKESESKRSHMPFRELTLTKAALTFTDEITGAVFKSSAMSFNIGRLRRDLHGSLTMPFTFNDKPGSIDAGLSTSPVSDQRTLNARLDQMPGELLCLLAQCPDTLKFDGPLSGKLTLKQMPGDSISGGSVTLSSEKAVLTAPETFAEPLKFKKLGIIASASDHFNTIVIDAATFDMPDTKIMVKANAAKKEDGWYAQGEAVCSKLMIEKLYKYWPLPMAADSRTWVTSKLSDGYAESGTLKFDFTPKDLEGDVMRAEAVDATVIARNLTIDYLQGFPKITNGDGTVKFTGKTITAHVTGGKLLTGTTIKPSTVTFTDLDVPETPMETDLNLNAPARDVATLLKLPPFTFDDGLNLDPETITGTGDANLKLSFDAFAEDAPGSAAEIDLSTIGYDVSATLTDIAQKGLMKGRDISGFSGTVKANKDGATLDGTVKLQGTDMQIVLKDGPSTHDTTLTAKGKLSRAQFASFGVPEIKQIGDGSIGIDAELNLLADSEELKRADIDLTGVPLTISEISYAKPAGAPAKLSIAKNATPNQYDYTMSAPDFALEGATLTFNEAGDDIVAATVKRLKTATSDFGMTYATKQPEGYKVSITGAALDVSGAYQGEPAETPDEEKPEEKAEPSLLADFPALDLDADLQQLMLVKDKPIRDFKGTLRCDPVRCTNADMTGKTGEGQLKVAIAPVNGARQLTIENSNAGDFLRAVDISDRMYGGRLSITGTYDDTQNPAPMSGRLMIQDFKLKNSQILARIISIGSLSGLVNVLTGSGIDFDKFSADIGSRAGVINVTKGRASSNAIGLTAEGSLDTNASKVNLKGVVVPANSLNSIFGKLPIIGALAGGEGEGLIAFNYSVKGPFDDPDVFVNPLSGLTPGFLRGIFRAGDAKVEAMPAAPGETKPAPDAAVPEQPVPWPSEKATK